MPTRRFRPILRSALVLSLASPLIIQSARPVWTWGRTGHRVISKLAERHVTDRARAEIRVLQEPGESLADCSTWADEHRRELPKTAPWHYVDVPFDEPRYDDRFASTRPGASSTTCVMTTLSPWPRFTAWAPGGD